MKLRYTAQAEKDLKYLPKTVADRILNKMDWYIASDDPLHFAKALVTPRQRLYRFEIGDYRAICRITNGEITILLVLPVRNRKDTYWDF